MSKEETNARCESVQQISDPYGKVQVFSTTAEPSPKGHFLWQF